MGDDLPHRTSRAPGPGVTHRGRARRARAALLAAGAAALLGPGWGCGDGATAPGPIRGLPEALTLRVGEERVLTPEVDQQYEHQWESSEPRVAAVIPSPGDCRVFPTCQVGPGVTATVRALAPGQATVRVFAPGRGTGPRTGATAAVVVTVQPAAP